MFTDPIKTARGFLSIKAYRLTPEAINIVQERDYTPEALKKGRLGFESLFQEIRLVVKNSHLVNTLLTELYEVSFLPTLTSCIVFTSKHLSSCSKFLFNVAL